MKTSELMKKEFVSLDKNDTVAEFLGKISGEKARDAVVLENGKFFGMTSKKLLIRSRFDPHQMKVSKITENSPCLKGDEDIVEIARLMFTADRQILPVVEDGRVIGIVKAIDVIEQIRNMPDLSKIRLGEIATRKLITIGEDEGIGKAVKLMDYNKIGRVPIIDKKGDVTGLISFRDVEHHILALHKGDRGSPQKSKTAAFGPKDFDVHAMPVSSLSKPRPITEPEEATVAKAIDDLRRLNISSIIVVKKSAPIGIVTVRDFIKLLIREQSNY